MFTIDVEKTPTKVTNTTGMYPEWLKEFTLEHKALVNGEETSITALIVVTVSDNHWVVELPHQRWLLGTYIRGIISQWLLDIGALGETPAEALEKVGRVYLFTERAYNKLINHLEIMCEKNKENNRHDHQH